MADKQITELQQLGTLEADAAFAAQQGGTAYQVTAAQIAAMGGGSGGSGGGDGTLYLDLTGQGEVNSLPESQDENDADNGFAVVIDGAALMAHTGPVAVRFWDSQFPGEVMTLHATNRRTMTDAEDGDECLRLGFAHVNPGDHSLADAGVRLYRSGDGYTARFYYTPYAHAKADMEEDNSFLPGYIKNNPVKVEDGHTYIENLPKIDTIDFTNFTDDWTGSFTVKREDGVSVTFRQGMSGNDYTLTDSEGHVTTIKGAG